MTSQKIEKSSSLAYLCVFFAALGSFLFGYDTAVISGALIFLVKEFSLSTLQQGVVVSMILIGALIGSLFAGSLADRLGRRRSIILNAIVFIIGNGICMVADSYNTLLLGRLITGVAIGVISIIAPLYLAEIAPRHSRGAFVSTHQLAITIGILAAYITNYALASRGDWRLMLGAALVPSALQLLGMLFLPESPSWYLTRGNQKKASDIFRSIRKDDLWKAQISEIKQLASLKSESSWKNFLKPSLKYALCIGVILSIFQQITGINTVIYYAPKIFQMAGYNDASSAIFASLALGIINTLFTGLSVWLLDRLGRKPLLLIGTAGMTLSLLVLSIAFFAGSSLIDRIAMVSLIAYVGFFALGLGPVTWVVLSEIYPLQMRGRAMGLALFVNWLFNYIVSLSFLNLLENLAAGGAFCLYAGFCLLAFWFVFRWIPETKGKSLEQIEKNFTAR